ncbi:hypothetical protein CLG96_01235 [Sphingomonas oleivorans]|uniref:Alginate export domain-containing protein n=1 Tax=Sphingomonas oleivorans TaxID=1735121 RepID=A0A2T5G104_9SPHN|nr:alginate export family protein [Sphingomonas oleivorans]PTQ12800.1 hypothetical protein CLG96_01235 [Sphingomonas oleivorans]
MRRFSACLLLSAVFATPAMAEPLKFKPLIDTRLRYEGVEQKGFAEDADAITLRARLGGELAAKNWSFLAEAEGTLAVDEDYNSGLNGKASLPLVADPENIELNRIQIQYKGLPKTVVTLGRQRINLDDQRFVGSVGWRQNEQTFDAARIEWSGVKDLKLDATYSWSARTIWGVDGGNAFGRARQQAIGGDNVFVNLSYKTPIGMLTGFTYLVDQDEAVISGFRNSSQTFGARFAGSYPVSKAVKLNYLASYARQSDYHRNPNDYSADYYLVEGGLTAAGVTLGGGYEVLGADNGVALTSFQTPLATLHKFQGWADKFLVTPPNGIRDLYGQIGYAKPKPIKGVDAITLTAAYHRFTADRPVAVVGRQHYGNELNAQLTVKVKKYTFLAKYADYEAKDTAPFASTDTRKLWLSVEWAF